MKFFVLLSLVSFSSARVVSNVDGSNSIQYEDKTGVKLPYWILDLLSKEHPMRNGTVSQGHVKGIDAANNKLEKEEGHKRKPISSALFIFAFSNLAPIKGASLQKGDLHPQIGEKPVNAAEGDKKDAHKEVIVAVQVVPHDTNKDKNVKKEEIMKVPEHGASKGKTPTKESGVHHGKQDNAAAAQPPTTAKPAQPEQPSMFWGAMTAIEKNFVKLIASIQGLFTSAAAVSTPAPTHAAVTPAPPGADAKKENHANRDTKVHIAESVALPKKQGAHLK